MDLQAMFDKAAVKLLCQGKKSVGCFVFNVEQWRDLGAKSVVKK